MTAGKMAPYQKTLQRLQHGHRYRELRRQRGIDFTSNDYLAYADSTQLRDAVEQALKDGIAIGAGGSRLLRGNHDIFNALESDASLFFKSEKSLYFGSGYAANMAIFSTLPKRGDMIFYDEHLHASALDGIAASKASAVSIKHNKLDCFASAIQTWRKQGGVGRPWIAVESLYSMDGDCAPLAELFELINQEDGFLVIDEAHATGVFGDQGRGFSDFLASRDHVIVLHTCGKALGVSGALVCLNAIFYEYLINRARPFIYSTAPSPIMAVAVREALRLLASDEDKRDQLKSLYQFVNEQLKMRLGLNGSNTQIVPIVIGDNKQAAMIAERLQQNGFDVRAIRPPTVPEGTARLRLSITLHVNEHDIVNLFSNLPAIMDEVRS